MSWQNKQKKSTFSDVLASGRPQEKNEVLDRWLFLKSEWDKKESKKERIDISLSFLIIFLTFFLFYLFT